MAMPVQHNEAQPPANHPRFLPTLSCPEGFHNAWCVHRPALCFRFARWDPYGAPATHNRSIGP
jgi:hypothetical protein